MEQEVILELTKRLIQMDTQNPPGNEESLVAFIVSYLNLKKEEYTILSHGGGRASLVIKIPGESKEATLFLGHLDTVPYGERGKWSSDPLHPEERDGYLYGLGASDMKSGVAVMIANAKEILQQRKKRKRTLYFVFTADEEQGCMGAREIARQEWFSSVSEIILSEPTDGKVAVAEKGAMWIQIEVEGRQAHGAMKQLGKNANEFLWKAINQLQDEVEEIKESPLLGKLSVSTTIFQGGFKCNIIPGYAKANLDIRTVQEENHAMIRKKLNEIKQHYENEYRVKIHYSIANEKKLLQAKEDSILVKKVLALPSMEQETIGIPYYTDLAELLIEHNCEFIVLGPGEIKEMHKVDERLRIRELARIGSVYQEFIERYC